jgi:hypothetical protein
MKLRSVGDSLRGSPEPFDHPVPHASEHSPALPGNGQASGGAIGKIRSSASRNGLKRIGLVQ